MEQNIEVAGNLQLAAAQAKALELGVPFAVLTCVTESELAAGPTVEKLQEVEAALAQYNIPLIILVGKPQNTLPGAIHHLNPLAVILEQTPVAYQIKLQKHPHAWPGAVLSITALQTIDTVCFY